MKGLFCRISILALAAAAVIAAPARAQNTKPQDDTLKLIIEKVREREALLDGFDWQISSRTYDGATDTTITTSSMRYVKSQGKWLVTYDWHDSRPRHDSNTSEKWACDGTLLRYMNRPRSGGVMENTLRSSQTCMIECDFGLRSVHGYRARLSEVLVGDMAKLRSNYGSDFKDIDLEVTLKEDVTVDGRSCKTIDIVSTSNWPEYPWTGVSRFYLAPDLGYACVAVEYGIPEDGQIKNVRTHAFGDLREVKKGLFIPWSATVTFSDDKDKTIRELQTEKFETRDKFDDSLFVITFPPGTRVFDSVANLDYVVGAPAAPETSPELVSLNDGTEMAEVKSTDSLADAGSPARDTSAPRQSSGNAPLTRRGTRRAIIAAVIPLTALAIVAFTLLWRRRTPPRQ